jgi:hypothetical protein
LHDFCRKKYSKMKNLFHFLYMFTGFDTRVTIPARSCPKAASPCPSAMGFASGECRAGLAGGRACMAGELAEWLRHFTPEDRPKGLLSMTNHLEGAKKNFNLKTQIVDARIRQ